MGVQISLVPDWFNFGLQLVSTLILLLVLSKFAWKPMKEFLEKRQEIVTQEISAAQNLQADAKELKAEAESRIDAAREEARLIVDASHRQAAALGAEIVAQANADANQKLAKAKAQIEQERKSVYANIRKDIVDLAIESAEKLIETEIKAQNHEHLFDDFLSKVGGSHE